MTNRVIVDMSMLRADEQAVLNAVARYQQSLLEERESGLGESRRVPASYTCSDKAVRRMSVEYRRQVSLNSVAQVAGLVEAGNTALGV